MLTNLYYKGDVRDQGVIYMRDSEHRRGGTGPMTATPQLQRIRWMIDVEVRSKKAVQATAKKLWRRCRHNLRNDFIEASTSLYRVIKFCQAFPDIEIIATPSQQLT